MKNNIGRLKDCYGCGVCTIVCPVKIINLKENTNGFYVPFIVDSEKCISCGLCLDVCSFNKNNLALDEAEPKSFAGFSKNILIRQRCSSGGIGFEIGRFLIEKGFEACGVRYNVKEERAEHFIASNIDDYTPSIGSKYIQSYTQDAFSAFNRNKKYFVSGTPCQIDSLRSYIKKYKIEENFVLLDFFCHGIPSMYLWRKYLREVEGIVGKVGYVAWRNKTNGWQNSWNINIDPVESENIDWHNPYNINIPEKNHIYQSRWKEGDLFYRFFLGNYCLNKCCYKSCKYKSLSSSADIRIGDLWGKAYKHDNLGTSAIISFTRKGGEILNELHDCQLFPISKDTCIEGQMKRCPTMPIIYKPLLSMLSKDESLSEIYNKIIKPYRFLMIPKRGINFFCYKIGIRPIFH